jgi:hypothetical protein
MKQRILFICGSLNQTTQLHQIARHLPEYEHWYTPYYADGLLEIARRLRLLEFTILGYKLRKRCEDYLERHQLPVDMHGAADDYDLVVTCTDLVMPRNVRDKRVVVVQEGILDPPSFGLTLWRRFPWLPLYLAGTATTGLSNLYERFCVASEGYRQHFISEGAPAHRVVVTGMPNFDDCQRYYENDFPHRGYVLACTSDARETLKGDDRRSFIASVLIAAQGRKIIFKLHPNENVPRATAEIEEWAPGALVYSTGSAEQMVANCDVLVTQYSSLSFVGMALGKEVHSYFPQEMLQRLLPVQNRRAALNIADVCREVLESPAPVRRAESMGAVTAVAEVS